MGLTRNQGMALAFLALLVFAARFGYVNDPTGFIAPKAVPDVHDAGYDYGVVVTMPSPLTAPVHYSWKYSSIALAALIIYMNSQKVERNSIIRIEAEIRSVLASDTYGVKHAEYKSLRQIKGNLWEAWYKVMGSYPGFVDGEFLRIEFDDNSGVIGVKKCSSYDPRDPVVKVLEKESGLTGSSYSTNPERSAEQSQEYKDLKGDYK